ncbi:hypothetical protein DEU56DRAFT_981231 [Suillus clintonianus]|uniref:uncharacterized protein n=1 Tax=Suillus clintonianus TaxID=1904413 RepID=UPI001B885C79|nr:uncharacterized protein DEU56DRAFT_981231 [Suillus clintonianus]KAG2135143.1 hypothetical protein DEU56DRAFT_981231 [Suillus clintonianus]
MTQISNDPSWWPVINYSLVYSYFIVAPSVMVAYDWGKPHDTHLDGIADAIIVFSSTDIWARVRTDLVATLVTRHGSISQCTLLWSNILRHQHTVEYPVSSGDRYIQHNDYNSCTILWVMQNCMPAVVIVILGVVMIIRLHAMYLGSRKMLIFLIVVFLALTIATGVILTVCTSLMGIPEEYVLSGMYQCGYTHSGENVPFLINVDWVLVTGLIWEVLTLSLAVWIVIKHFHEMRQQSTRWNVKDCFTVLIKTHVFYFAAFVLFSCFTFSELSPKLWNISSVGVQIYGGVIPVLSTVQLFVLGPRLILDIRAYNAQVLVNSDEETVMTAIVFHERTYELTANSDV